MPPRPLPPARHLEDGVLQPPALSQFDGSPCQQRGTRLSSTRIVRADVIIAITLGEERTPVNRSEHRPERHGANVCAAIANLGGSGPDVLQPSDLLFTGATVVDFGDGDRELVAVPDFLKAFLRPDLAPQPVDTNCFEIDIGLLPVRAGFYLWVAFDPMVKIPLAGEVMIHPDHVGLALT